MQQLKTDGFGNLKVEAHRKDSGSQKGPHAYQRGAAKILENHLIHVIFLLFLGT